MNWFDRLLDRLMSSKFFENIVVPLIMLVPVMILIAVLAIVESYTGFDVSKRFHDDLYNQPFNLASFILGGFLVFFGFLSLFGWLSHREKKRFRKEKQKPHKPSDLIRLPMSGEKITYEDFLRMPVDKKKVN